MQKIICYLLILFSLIFLLGYTLITYNNVYYGDDLHFINMIAKYGLINVSKNIFLHFECPFTLPFNLSLLYLSSKLGGIFSLNLFILITNIFSLYLFLNKLLSAYLSRIQNLLLSIFVISLIYSCTRSVGLLSTIFWADGQLPYVLSITYLFLWLYFFLRYKTDGGKLNLHILGFLCFILMNTKLNYCLFFLTYFSAGIFYDFLLSKNINSGKRYRIKYFFAYLLFLLKKKENLILLVYTIIGLGFYVLNPGNFERIKFDGQSPLSTSPFDYVKALLIGQKHFYLMIVSSPRFLVVLTLLAVFVINNIKLKIDILLKWQGLLIHFIAFCLGLVLQTLLMKAVFGTPIYQGRVFFLSEFLFLFLFAHFIYYFYQLYFSGINLKLVHVISIPIVLFVLAAELKYFIMEINTVRKFKIAHDNRTSLIISEKVKNRGEPLYLESLPSSGVLGIAEISRQQQMGDAKVYYENKRIENYYDLPFKIYLKDSTGIKSNKP